MPVFTLFQKDDWLKLSQIYPRWRTNFLVSSQINKVNSRKEFFKVPLASIKNKVDELGLNTHWTMKAEALEYRESLQLERQRSQKNQTAELAEA